MTSSARVRETLALGLQGKVSEATAQAKQLRRNALRGATVIFVTAGYSGKRFIFERCKELGVRSIVVDGPESWSKGLVDDGLAEAFIEMDFSDADTLFERLLHQCRKVPPPRHRTDASQFCATVCTHVGETRLGRGQLALAAGGSLAAH